jgi:tetratricopeptide (TPR) repeat protein
MDVSGLRSKVEEQAEKSYEQALESARRAGDKGQEGAILQHLGFLAATRGAHALAVTRYTEAIARFQTTDDRAAVMQTADLLGSAEKSLEHYDAARTWYAEAERLAKELGDEVQLAVEAHNIGILLQRQAMALPAEAREERGRLLAEAAASVATSLALEQKAGDTEGAGGSFFQLSVIHRLLGNLDEAERHAQQSLAFYEPADLPDVAKVYGSLENIAEARNRPVEAAAWRAKKEAKLAEAPAPGAGPPQVPMGRPAQPAAEALPPEAREGFLAICQSLHDLRSTGKPLRPDAADAIGGLITQPEPLGAVGRFLQGVVDGAIPDVPSGIPPELEAMFTALVTALRKLPPAASPAAPAAAPAAAPDTICPCGSGRPFLACHGASD